MEVTDATGLSQLAGEYIDYLRPQTIIGRLATFDRRKARRWVRRMKVEIRVIQSRPRVYIARIPFTVRIVERGR